MDGAELEDPSPINPFRYWKERIKDQDTGSKYLDRQQQKPGGSSSESSSSAGQNQAPVSTQPGRRGREQGGEVCGTRYQNASKVPIADVLKKKTPPPRPARGPSLSPPPSSSSNSIGSLVEKQGSAQQGGIPVQKAHPAVQGGGIQERITKLEAHTQQQQQLPNSSDAESYMPKMKKQQQQQQSSRTVLEGVVGQSQLRVRLNSGGSGKKLDLSPRLPAKQTSSGRHKLLAKSTSNPVVPERPVVALRPRGALKSTSGVDTGNQNRIDFSIPSIQTIRASTGDDLSINDSELFRPAKGSVLDAAKKMDGGFLSPQGHRIRKRRSSGGDIHENVSSTTSASSNRAQTPISPSSIRRNATIHSPGSNRRALIGSSSSSTISSLSSTTSSVGSSTPGPSLPTSPPRSIVGSPSSTFQGAASALGTSPRKQYVGIDIASTDRLRNWRSQSTSKLPHRPYASIKIKSSGFTSYLDGPVDAVGGEDASVTSSTSSPLVPPPSPLHEMSYFLKSNNVPEGNHLRPAPSASQETTQFWDMVQRLQSQYCPGNRISLSSVVLSQRPQRPKSPSISRSRRHDSVYLSATSRTKETVLVRVMDGITDKPPAQITCNVKTNVQSVVSMSLDEQYKASAATKDPQEYSLKVCGKDEILEDNRLLCDFEYVHQCRKFAVAVELVLVERRKPSPLCERRSPQPDFSPSSPGRAGSKCVSVKEGNALLDSYHAKENMFRSFLKDRENKTYPFSILTTLVQSVVSCVKLLCERLSFIEPPEVTDAVFNLRRACKAASQPELDASSFFPPDDAISVCSSASENWVTVPENDCSISEDHVEDMVCALDVLHQAVHHLMSLYCRSYQPGYLPQWDQGDRERASVASLDDRLLRIKVDALHRPLEAELRKYDTLQLECCVYHGGKALSKRAYSPHAKIARNFFNTVVWSKWLSMSIPVASLPRESRVLFTLHGLEFPGSGVKWSRIPIAWTILRIFDCNGGMLQGSHLLGMWLGEDTDPLDSPYNNMHNRKSMILQIELESHEKDFYFHTPITDQSKSKLPGPPPNVSKMLTAITQKDRFYTLTTSDQKIIWANRLACVSLLGNLPRGLPMVLMASQTSNSTLADTWKIIQLWKMSDPIYGLELLDAQFADMKAREKAVEWLSHLGDDDICDFLPQLVQSLRFDCYLSSPMAEFLLKRSTVSHRIAHALFWHLRLVTVTDMRFRARYVPILEALEKLCGEQLRQEFNNQVELVEQLCAVATTVKGSRDSHRQTTLVQELKAVADKFIGQFRLPLNPSLLVKGIDIESCSFFNSNTVPLKLSFLNADPYGSNINIIFKVGDDLRQDIVILQMIRLMEKIWLRAGLDLRMVTYECVATGEDQGMLEMVTESATLRAIQTEHGLTGSFKDKPLSEWLQRHNTTESAYKQAVENFTYSCAGYCVATYILGICDRHNDNIMVKRSGHMFHIDFGKILGNAQMFGNIKRDRAPFVLTRDMAYVINDGDKPTVQFQKFCDLCCTAYNELRKHTTLFVSLLSLILSSGLPEISSLEDVQYVRDALLPGKSEAEATYAFTKHIESSLSSVATTLNFFIHNLAQFKFSSSSNTPCLLSFCPQAYSIATDGKIESAIITTYHKWFYPETFYVYQVEVQRQGAPEKEKIFRRYREFDELQTKLEQYFPDFQLPQLPGKIFIPGKSHTKQTTERRMIELNMYLASILSMPRHISESDIIYTFLHCLIRDEQDWSKLSEDEVRSSDYGAGKVKLELQYAKKQDRLTVMVRHVRDLSPRDGLDTADPYVKLYLLPDQNKITKQKTKISRKTLNPTYNETFSYIVPFSILGNRALQLSIWDASNMLSNHCMCMTTIEFSKLLTQLGSGSNFVEWFDLYSLPDL